MAATGAVADRGPSRAGYGADLGVTDGLVVLAARARGGDDDALETLAEALYGPVTRFLGEQFPALAPDVLADAVQETLGRIARRVGDCGAATDRQVRAWAFTAARRTTLNYLRSTASGAELRARAAPLSAARPASARRALQDSATPATAARSRVHPGSGAAELADVSAPDGGAPLGAAREALCRLAVAAQDALTEAEARLVWSRVVGGAAWEHLVPEFGGTPKAAKRRFQRAQDRLRARCVEQLGAMPVAERAPLLAHLGLPGA
jgi:DNA-directed RNA polymerase specialized sigma24 family protein